MEENDKPIDMSVCYIVKCRTPGTKDWTTMGATFDPATIPATVGRLVCGQGAEVMIEIQKDAP